MRTCSSAVGVAEGEEGEKPSAELERCNHRGQSSFPSETPPGEGDKHLVQVIMFQTTKGRYCSSVSNAMKKEKHNERCRKCLCDVLFTDSCRSSSAKLHQCEKVSLGSWMLGQH